MARSLAALILGPVTGLGLLAVGTPWQPAAEMPAPVAPAFETDVLPLLQREGCSSAYCHGGATGKGGLKLSLFGGDADADWHALAVDLDGRRLDHLLPEKSLVLQKAAEQTRHGGGRRIDEGGTSYQVLKDWIARGAPRGGRAGVTALEISLHGDPGPTRARVVATFADGTTRDVTHLAQVTSTHPHVVDLGAGLELNPTGLGEAFLLARYAGADAVLRVVRPVAQVAAEAPRNRTPTHGLDGAWLDHLSEVGLSPAPPAPAHRQLRRLYLDLVGRLPTQEELSRFASKEDPVGTAADVLLADPEFATVFSRHLADWLALPSGGPQESMAASVRGRLLKAVADATPLDALVTEFLNPGHALVQRHGDPRDRAEYVAQTFLGIRLGCARCHDHPQDRWRQRDHLGMSALLATRRLGDGRLVQGAAYDDDGHRGTPRLLPLAGAAPDDLDAFAQVRWLALKGSDAFARTMSNRLLKLLLGQAPVEPVDDIRPTNPPRGGDLLDRTVAEFRRTGGDLRAMVRFIVTSARYQVDLSPDGSDEGLAAALGACHVPMPLPPELQLRMTARALSVPVPQVAMPASPLATALLFENGVFDLTTVRDSALCQSLVPLADEAAVAKGFWHLLSRPPTAAEAALAEASLAQAPDRPTAIAELLRALISTRAYGSRR